MNKFALDSNLSLEVIIMTKELFVVKTIDGKKVLVPVTELYIVKR